MIEARLIGIIVIAALPVVTYHVGAYRATQKVNAARDAKAYADAVSLVNAARTAEASAGRDMAQRAQTARDQTATQLEALEDDRTQLAEALALSRSANADCRISMRAVRVLDGAGAGRRDLSRTAGPASGDPRDPLATDRAGRIGRDAAGAAADHEAGGAEQTVDPRMVFDAYIQNREVAYALTAANLETCKAAYSAAQELARDANKRRDERGR